MTCGGVYPPNKRSRWGERTRSSGTTIPSTMLVCSKCAAENPDSARECKTCGTALAPGNRLPPPAKTTSLRNPLEVREMCSACEREGNSLVRKNAGWLTCGVCREHYCWDCSHKLEAAPEDRWWRRVPLFTRHRLCRRCGERMSEKPLLSGYSGG